MPPNIFLSNDFINDLKRIASLALFDEPNQSGNEIISNFLDYFSINNQESSSNPKGLANFSFQISIAIFKIYHHR